MNAPNSGWKNWGDHPIVVFIGVLAALIAIITFITGKSTLGAIIVVQTPIPSVVPTLIVPTQPIETTLEPTVGGLSSEPIIINIEGTTGTVGSNPVLKISYTDAECDVNGGQWDGVAGSGISARFGSSGSCSRGIGIIYYERTCSWAGSWRDHITLFDVEGHRSSIYEYTYTCSRP